MLSRLDEHTFINPSVLTMFKKRSESTDILTEESAYNEAIHRLIAARTRGERFSKELVTMDLGSLFLV